MTGAIESPIRGQDWTLDVLGNWGGLVEKTSGTTTLNQSRTHNKVNEIDVEDNDAGASITASMGTNWSDPEYDKNGNMDYGPVPGAPLLETFHS